MNKKKKRKGSDSMVDTIEKIITYNNSLEQHFMNYQENRIQQLKDMLNRKERGEYIDISEITDNLKEIGILNEDGSLSSYYKLED